MRTLGALLRACTGRPLSAALTYCSHSQLLAIECRGSIGQKGGLVKKDHASDNHPVEGAGSVWLYLAMSTVA